MQTWRVQCYKCLEVPGQHRGTETFQIPCEFQFGLFSSGVLRNLLLLPCILQDRHLVTQVHMGSRPTIKGALV